MHDRKEGWNNKMIFKTINRIAHKFGYDLKNIIPRTSTLFAKRYFMGKPVRAIEIGVYKGENSVSLLKHLNIKQLYLIDPFEIEAGDLNKHLPVDILDARTIARSSVYGDDRVTWIEKKSSEAIGDINGKVDFVYIDGNHKYKNVLEDMEKYVPIVKKGGIVAGHDVNVFEVAQAVIHYCDKYNIKAVFDFPDWWFIK